MSQTRVTNHPDKSSPKKNLLGTPDKLDALIDSSVLSPKLDELKIVLRLSPEKMGTLKECHTSLCKSTIPSSPKSLEKKLPFKCLFASGLHSIQTESLVLPRKYKMLAEMFRNMDALVATLNNRKENITFQNVKECLQKIMKKNISENHLGQIVTVFPSAYILSREKARCISKKNNAGYPLVIVPNIAAEKDNNLKMPAFQPMTPACLANRINQFNNNLLDYLEKIKFATASSDNTEQWHPKFPDDIVPDVPVAQLPELPKMKVYTAKDVLNELGSIQVQAKELARFSKTVTQTSEEKKKLAMMERVPKIAKIVLHYFITERKTSLPVDAVVDKIIYSFKSLSTPDVIKEHLELIAEQFPGWLKFKQIPKGLYLTIEKNTNINEMLDKAGMY